MPSAVGLARRTHPRWRAVPSIAGVTAWLRGNPDKAAEVRRRVLAGEAGPEPASKNEDAEPSDETDDWLM